MTAKYLLEAQMKLHHDTQSQLAKELGMSPQTFSVKINSKEGAEFSQNEIYLIKSRYNLTADEVEAIFFTH